MKLKTETTYWPGTKGDADYLNTRGTRGTGGNTLGIREDNQTLDTGGRARYLKREGKLVNFKIKQEMMRQDMKKKLNHDRLTIVESVGTH